jgi:hypothetical protein
MNGSSVLRSLQKPGENLQIGGKIKRTTEIVVYDERYGNYVL